MKAFKILAILAGVLALLLGTVVLLAFTSPVQTWFARRAVANIPGTSIEFERVSAGMSGARIEGLQVRTAGIELNAAEASAAFSAWGLIFGDRIDLESATLRDLVLDLRNAPRATSAVPTTTVSAPATPATPGPAVTTSTPMNLPWPGPDGILGSVRLPMPLRIGTVDGSGRVLLAGGRTVTFSMSGSDIATGSEGTLTWTLGFTDSTAGAPVSAAEVEGSLTARLSESLQIDGIDVVVELAATGPGLPADRVRLSLGAIRGSPEIFTVDASLLRGGVAENLATSRAEYLPTGRSVSGSWTVAARAEQFSALLNGLGLPALAAAGNGGFEASLDAGTAAARGVLDVTASGLDRYSPALAVLGNALVHVDFDARLAGQVARLERLQVQASAGDGRRLVEVAALQPVSYGLADGRISVANPGADLARVSAQDLPLVWAQPFVSGLSIDSGLLSLVLDLEAEANGEQARVRAPQPIVVRDLTISQAGTALVSRATISLLPEVDYTPAAIEARVAELSVGLPAGDSISGSVDASIDRRQASQPVSFTAAFEGRVVDALRAYTPVNTGPLSFSTELQGRLNGNLLQVNRATVIANRDNGLLFAAETAQAVTFNTASSAITANNPTATALRLRLGEIPLTWAQPYLVNATVAGRITGGGFDVTFHSPEQLAVSTTSPLGIAGASYAADGRELARGIDASIDMAASRNGAALAYQLRRAEVRAGESVIAAASLEGNLQIAGTPTGTVRGSVEADLGAALSQPALLSYAALSRGTLATTIDGSFGDAIQATATVSLRNLVARQGNRPLGNIDISPAVSLAADGSGTVRLPLVLVNGNRRSDITIEGNFNRSGNATSFNGRVAGTALHADDFIALSGLAPAASATTPRPAAAPVRADAAPFWSGFTGRIDTDLRNLTFGTYALSSLRGALAVSEERLAIDAFEGRFREDPFRLTGAIGFAGGQALPYSLSGTLNVSDLDVGEILRAANPGERPTIETKATLVSQLSGRAATPARFAESLTGQFDINGSAGVLRALGRRGETVGVLSTGLGILGALQGSDTTMAIADLAAELNEMRFERFTMKVERGADLNLRLTTLEFLSPNKRITGSGSIAYQADVPISRQPLTLNLNLAGKDSFALLLNRAGILGTTPDAQGYTPLTSGFAITGTPARPDSGQFWAMVTRAAAGRLLGR